MGGPKWRSCPICWEGIDEKNRNYSPIRAVYIRIPGKGFVRIGWYFEKCKHVDVTLPP